MAASLGPIAQQLRGAGRNGDTVLAHISPDEARMLIQMGGAGTINPSTGLPEFYQADTTYGQSGGEQTFFQRPEQTTGLLRPPTQRTGWEAWNELSPEVQKYYVKKGAVKNDTEFMKNLTEAQLLENINSVNKIKGGIAVSNIGEVPSAAAPLIAQRNKRGVGGALGTILNIGLPILTSMIPGIGPVLGGALGGALAGGVTSGSLGGALKGAGVGALGGLASGTIGGVMKGQGVLDAAKSTLSQTPGLGALNPKIAGKMASGVINTTPGNIISSGSVSPAAKAAVASSAGKAAGAAASKAGTTSMLDKVLSGDIGGVARGALDYAMDNPLKVAAIGAGLIQDSGLERGSADPNAAAADYRARQAADAAKFMESLGQPIQPRGVSQAPGSLYTYGQAPTSHEHMFFEPLPQVQMARGGEVKRPVMQENSMAELAKMVEAGLIHPDALAQIAFQLDMMQGKAQPMPRARPERSTELSKGFHDYHDLDALPSYQGYAEGGMVTGDMTVDQLIEQMNQKDPYWETDPAKVRKFNMLVDEMRKRQEAAGLMPTYDINGPFRYARGGLSMTGSAAGGQDDTIPAKLSEGEYVIPADTVAALGDGNPKAGAKKLERMTKNVRRHKSGTGHPPKAGEPDKYMEGKNVRR